MLKPNPVHRETKTAQCHFDSHGRRTYGSSSATVTKFGRSLCMLQWMMHNLASHLGMPSCLFSECLPATGGAPLRVPIMYTVQQLERKLPNPKVVPRLGCVAMVSFRVFPSHSFRGANDRTMMCTWRLTEREAFGNHICTRNTRGTQLRNGVDVSDYDGNIAR